MGRSACSDIKVFVVLEYFEVRNPEGMDNSNSQLLMSPRILGAAALGNGTEINPKIDIEFVINGFRRQAFFMASLMVIGFLVAGMYLVLKTPKYTGSTFIQLQTEEPKVFLGDGGRPDNLINEAFVEGQINLLRSTRIANRLIAGLTAEERAAFFQANTENGGWLSSKLSGVVGSALSQLKDGVRQEVSELEKSAKKTENETPDSSERQLALQSFMDRMEIRRQGRSYIVEVAFSDERPERAARMSNALTEAYLQDRIDSKIDGNRASAQRIEKQLAALTDEILKTEEQVQNFRVMHKILGFGGSDLEERQLRDSAIELVSLRQQITETESKIQKLRGSSKKQGYDSDELEALKLDLERFKASEARELKNRANLIKLNELEREVTASRELYSSLLRRHKEIKADLASINAGAVVIAPAVAPLWASGPRRAILFGAVALLWVALVTFAGFIKELTRRNLLSASDVEGAFGLRCIAEIPDVPGSPQASPQASNSWHLLNHGSKKSPIYWDVGDRTHDEFNQEIFRLRHWTENASRQSTPILLIVSPRHGEGRSTIALQIARSSVAAGNKVLLVDGDFRTSGITRALDLSHVSKTRDITATQKTDEKTFQTVDYENIDICPSTTSAGAKPPSLLASTDMMDRLKTARQHYDLIVIDTPPMMEFADATALLNIAESAIIAVRYAKTMKQEVRKLIAELEESSLPKAAIALVAVPS